MGTSTGSDRVVVIGGGIIGAMTAWHLIEAGSDVTLVDQCRFGSACSRGNCGYVCPSHVLPLAQPGAIRSTLSKMLGPGASLRIKPRLSGSLYRWLFQFARHCNQRDMLSAARDRHALLQSSMQLYEQLINRENIDCEWHSRGLLFVFDTEREFAAYERVNQLVSSTFGVSAVAYDNEALLKLEPTLKPGLGGGWHYEQDCHLRPDKLLAELQQRLEQRGMKLIEHFTVDELVADNGAARAVRHGQSCVEADSFVVATGAMTPFLNRQLGCRIPIEPGKGYSLTMAPPERMPRIPMIFEQSHVAVTPMETRYRLGSTMEFVGYDRSIKPARIALLRHAAERYLVEPCGKPELEQWYGWRPMTWDGKPVIDRSPALSNVWIAAGHGMLGLSMAPATGKLISELLHGQPTHVDIKPFSLSRFHKYQRQT